MKMKLSNLLILISTCIFTLLLSGESFLHIHNTVARSQILIGIRFIN